MRSNPHWAQPIVLAHDQWSCLSQARDECGASQLESNWRSRELLETPGMYFRRIIQ
jgi:hypothetical protein